jgi:hypothetical protein
MSLRYIFTHTHTHTHNTRANHFRSPHVVSVVSDLLAQPHGTGYRKLYKGRLALAEYTEEVVCAQVGLVLHPCRKDHWNSNPILQVRMCACVLRVCAACACAVCRVPCACVCACVCSYVVVCRIVSCCWTHIDVWQMQQMYISSKWVGEEAKQFRSVSRKASAFLEVRPQAQLYWCKLVFP